MLIGSNVVGSGQDQIDTDFQLITYRVPFDTAHAELREIVKLTTWQPRCTTPHSVSGNNYFTILTSNICTVSDDNLPPCAYMHRCFCDLSLVVSLDPSVLPRRLSTPTLEAWYTRTCAATIRPANQCLYFRLIYMRAYSVFFLFLFPLSLFLFLSESETGGFTIIVETVTHR